MLGPLPDHLGGERMDGLDLIFAYVVGILAGLAVVPAFRS
jgi:hypothetical protein